MLGAPTCPSVAVLSKPTGWLATIFYTLFPRYQPQLDPKIKISTILFEKKMPTEFEQLQMPPGHRDIHEVR